MRNSRGTYCAAVVSLSLRLLAGLFFCFCCCSCVHDAVVQAEPLATGENAAVAVAVADDDNEYADTSRIVGGTNAPQGRYPYFVRMVDCAASLIAPDWILTTAVCARYDRVGDNVTIGAVYKNSTEGGAVTRTIEQCIFDPTFVGLPRPTTAYFNDFALCRLSSAVYTHQFIQINDNPSWPPYPTTSDLMVIGLGMLQDPKDVFNYTDIFNNFPSQLQHVSVPLVSIPQCIQAYDSSRIKDPENICASELGKDACIGDGGAPLIYTKNNIDYHTGTVSWGTGCASADYPGVYSRTSSRAEWIKSTICTSGYNMTGVSLCGTSPTPPSTPSPPSTDVGCDGAGGKNVNIKVITDQNPERLSYTIKDSITRKKILVSKKFRKPLKSYQKSICMSVGMCFDFKIKDKFGEIGVRDDSSPSPPQQQLYELLVSGTVVKTGTEFGKTDRYSECIDDGTGTIPLRDEDVLPEPCHDRKGSFNVQGLKKKGWTCFKVGKIKKKSQKNKCQYKPKNYGGQTLAHTCPVSCGICTK